MTRDEYILQVAPMIAQALLSRPEKNHVSADECFKFAYEMAFKAEELGLLEAKND